MPSISTTNIHKSYNHLKRPSQSWHWPLPHQKKLTWRLSSTICTCEIGQRGVVVGPRQKIGALLTKESAQKLLLHLWTTNSLDAISPLSDSETATFAKRWERGTKEVCNRSCLDVILIMPGLFYSLNLNPTNFKTLQALSILYAHTGSANVCTYGLWQLVVLEAEGAWKWCS